MQFVWFWLKLLIFQLRKIFLLFLQSVPNDKEEKVKIFLLKGSDLGLPCMEANSSVNLVLFGQDITELWTCENRNFVVPVNILTLFVCPIFGPHDALPCVLICSTLYAMCAMCTLLILKQLVKCILNKMALFMLLKCTAELLCTGPIQPYKRFTHKMHTLYLDT